jgi:glycosyltransferase involved in cell wall biosynthesis
MATRNKAMELDRTLRSIRNQVVAFDYEIVVADDGSTDNTRSVCARRHVDKYTFIPNDTYRNPSVARNVSYRNASGGVVIAQSDDVIHASENVIERLVLDLQPGKFIVATVFNWHIGNDGIWHDPIPVLTGRDCQRPFFFLGSLQRRDLYAVGGNDEDFVAPAFEDDWFGDCLIRGLGLRAVYAESIVGHHQHHDRPANLHDLVAPSRMLYRQKKRESQEGVAPWCAAGGPWPYVDGRSYFDSELRDDRE